MDRRRVVGGADVRSLPARPDRHTTGGDGNVRSHDATCQQTRRDVTFPTAAAAVAASYGVRARRDNSRNGPTSYDDDDAAHVRTTQQPRTMVVE